MDPQRFDSLARSLAATKTRRGLLSSLAALGAGLLGARGATNAQVTQVYCGNQFCSSNPGSCKPGCVCCVYTNSITGQVTNSRCRPPGQCSPGTEVGGATTTTVAPTTTATPTTTTTAQPTTTTVAPTTTTTTAAPTTTSTTQPPTTTTTTTTATPVITCGGMSCLPGEDVCLANGTCADTCVCSGPENCEACPAGCACGTDSVEGPQRCIPLPGLCPPNPVPCTSTAQCPRGTHCQIAGCGQGGANGGFCLPLCTSTPPCPNLSCGGVCCLTGQNVCLDNGSCAETCVCGATCEPTCPAGCACGTDSVEGPQHCIPLPGSCPPNPVPCTSTAQCPQGQQCQIAPCGQGGANSGFCLSLCTTS